ncbi:hypothetical protein Tco_1521794 [Tanacetum coccineum]
MGNNLDNAGKFMMYPRFMQVFLDKQLEEMESRKRIYVTPFHTKNIFRNLRRVGKGFSGRDTPLFLTMMVQVQQEHGEGSEMPTDPHHTPTIIQPSTSQPQLKQRSRRTKRKNTEVPHPSGPTTNIADKAVNEEMDDSLVRAATTTSSLEAEQDSGVNTPRSDEDRQKLNKLMEFCTKLQQKVLDLLKLRVNKLEKKRGSRTYKLKRLYMVGRSVRVISSDEASLRDHEDTSKQRTKINDIDKDAEIKLVHETQERYGDEEMFDTGVLDGDEVLVEPEVTIKDVNLSVDEVTLAQELAALKIAKPKADKVVLQEPEQGTITTNAATTVIAASTRPKAKGLVIHEEEQATTPTVASQQPSQVKVQDNWYVPNYTYHLPRKMCLKD